MFKFRRHPVYAFGPLNLTLVVGEECPGESDKLSGSD